MDCFFFGVGGRGERLPVSCSCKDCWRRDDGRDCVASLDRGLIRGDSGVCGRVTGGGSDDNVSRTPATLKTSLPTSRRKASIVARCSVV